MLTPEAAASEIDALLNRRRNAGARKVFDYLRVCGCERLELSDRIFRAGVSYRINSLVDAAAQRRQKEKGRLRGYANRVVEWAKEVEQTRQIFQLEDPFHVRVQDRQLPWWLTTEADLPHQELPRLMREHANQVRERKRVSPHGFSRRELDLATDQEEELVRYVTGKTGAPHFERVGVLLLTLYSASGWKAPRLFDEKSLSDRCRAFQNRGAKPRDLESVIPALFDFQNATEDIRPRSHSIPD